MVLPFQVPIRKMLSKRCFAISGLLVTVSIFTVQQMYSVRYLSGNVFGVALKSLANKTWQLEAPSTRLLTAESLGVTPGESSYHRHWDANCPALFAGDEAVIQDTAYRIGEERDKMNGNLSVPTDAEIQGWTLNCEMFRQRRGYPRYPQSNEEANFPLAYTIVTHTTASLVERLLRAIYQPQNVYCIHPDKGSSDEFHGAIRGLADCFDNVFIASKLERVQYAGFTRLLADINCMRDLTGPRAENCPWKYLINLCGQDFPLKTNLEIVRQMRFYNGTNDIVSYAPPPGKKFWTFVRFTVNDGRLESTAYEKAPPPHHLRVYNGNAYFAATREFIKFALTDSRAADLLEWTRDTYSPDENFWATLQRVPGAPGGFPLTMANRAYKFRYVKWVTNPLTPECRFGKPVHQVCVFGVDYLQYLGKVPHLFANKFHNDFDPVTIQCLEERLQFRSTHPEESERLPDFPLRNYLAESSPRFFGHKYVI